MMKNLLTMAVVVMMLSAFAFADVRRPDDPKTRPSKAVDTTLSISIDGNAKVARLIIPRSQLRQLRAELDQLESDDDIAATGNFTKTQTIVSGLFLSLALVFAGVWFARSGKIASRSARAMAIAAGVFASGAFATFMYANAGPPTDARSITGKIFTPSVHMYKQAWGKIKLEVSDEERSVRLIVPDVPKTASE